MPSADDVTLPAQNTSGTGAGTVNPDVACENIAGRRHQLVKIEHGSYGTGTCVEVTAPLPVASQQPLTPVAPSTGVVDVNSTLIVVARAARKGLVIVNCSASKVSLGLDTGALLNRGITLMPNGGAWSMDAYSFFVGAVTAIASQAGSVVAIQEFE